MGRGPGSRGTPTDGAQLGLDALDAGFVPRPLLRITPARLAVWDDCPRRYRLAYVDRPAPPRAGGRAHSTLGAVVHLALRALLALPGPARTPDAAAALVDRHWSDEGFRDAVQAAEYRERARTWVADYAEELDPDADVVGLERWVSAATGRLVVEGRVDRVDARGDELVVVDYKTGRRAPGAADAAGSQALALYALAVQRTMHRPCRRVELHHLPTGEVAAFRHDDASVEQHVSRAEASAEAAADAGAALHAGDGSAEELFPARPAPRCGLCEVRRHCPEGRAAAPESEPWTLLAP